MNNKYLIHENFNLFIEFIGLKEIWSTEKEQDFLWESIKESATDKQKIDYDCTQRVIISLFEDDDDKDISDSNDDDNFDSFRLNDSNNKNLLNSKGDIKNEKYIDEFINNIHNNQDTLYYIRFINEIFFNKLCKDDKNIDNDNINEEKIKVNIDDILDKMKNNYKFININDEVLKNYLEYIKNSKDLHKTENEKNTYYLNKDLVNYVNSIIDMKIEENNKNHNINLNNSNISNNNINGNSIEFSIEKLSLSDKNIINCIDGIISFNSNVDFIKLIKKYIENYILYLRQSIYNDLKSKELELQQKIIQSNNTCNKCNKDIDKKNLIFRNYTKLNLRKIKELIDNKLANLDETTSFRKSISMPKEEKRKYTVLKGIQTEKELIKTKLCNNNIELNILKADNKILNGNKSFTISCIDNIEDFTSSQIDIFMNKGNINGDQFFLETTKLFNDNIEDDDKSEINKTDSIKNNQTITKTSMESKKETKVKKTKFKDSNINIDTCSDINNNENNDSCLKVNNDFISDDFNGDLDEKSSKKKNNNNNNNNINNFFTQKSKSTRNNNYFINGNDDLIKSDINSVESINSIDNSFNTYVYGPLNKKYKSDFNKKYNMDETNKNTKSNFFDFEYLTYSHRIKRIFSLYNENMDNLKFFSQEVNAHFSKKNKQICILIISYFSIYFLKPDSLECIKRLNIKLLENITISSNNFNLLLLSFKGGTDIIIESFQRMHILSFLQKAINERNLEKEIKMRNSNKFFIRKKNRKDTILTYNNKMFNLTPNFENAQKIGILLKYQENIFNASFHKKLVILCSVGLIYFSDNYKTPKEIIPIIGTSVKNIAVRTNEIVYCLKLITINDETYIFGSLIKMETLDWKKEILKYKKEYEYKMKQINPNYSRKTNKFEEKETDDFFSK